MMDAASNSVYLLIFSGRHVGRLATEDTRRSAGLDQ